MLCDLITTRTVDPTPENSQDVNWDESGWTGDDWSEPDTDEEQQFILKDVRCEIRGVIDGGLRLAGTTQNMDEIYENVDWIKGEFPFHVPVTNEMVITNIRGWDGELIWRDEEDEEGGNIIATQFNVRGVTPTVDAFSQVIQKHVLAKKVEVRH
jgi:hypothetical protein